LFGFISNRPIRGLWLTRHRIGDGLGGDEFTFALGGGASSR
jgi:hypothetical protein